MTPVQKATVTVHWATGPVNVCIEHAGKLMAIGRMLGVHVAVTIYDGEEQRCINCINESKKGGAK